MQDLKDAPLLSKKTVVIGASSNPTRYAFLATSKLQLHGHEVVPLGIKSGEIDGLQIQNINEKPMLENVDTVTLYLNPDHQKQWEDYILGLKPHRIIFNPGTENPAFKRRAQNLGIETQEACTLVMLSIGNY